MQIIERGRGEPLVLIPGLQGRWEYIEPTVDALAKHFHVATFSLCDEPSASHPFDASRPFDSYAAQVTAVFDALRWDRAVVCGVSFGGLVAMRFAATHPNRVAALVLASTPGPGWHLKRRHELYARLPWLLGPLFFAELPFRATGELMAALPDPRERSAFGRRMLSIPLRAPVSPARMAARARRIADYDTLADCARIAMPTLVLTGEAGLDHVVPVEGTSQYGRVIAGAQSVILERTGHQGTLTRADDFAGLVRDFVERHGHAAA